MKGLIKYKFADTIYNDYKIPIYKGLYLKYAKALEWLSEQALKVGLKITADEAKGLIESAVLTLKSVVK